MTRILITGGAGFIGSRLTLALNAAGHEVTVLDNLSPQIHGDQPERSPLFLTIAGKARHLHGSVTDRHALSQALEGQEAIVHLAAETGTGQSMYKVDHYVAVNIQATATMLDLLSAGRHAVRRLVVASSRAIYGEGKYLDSRGRAVYPAQRQATDMEQGKFGPLDPETGAPLTLVPTDEDSRIHPTSVYGITKQVQEQLVMTVCPTIGIAPVALRYQNVFGPGQSLSNPYTGILSIFSNLIMQGGEISIFEDGQESRDFVFIDDVVDATMRAITCDRAAGQVFNVGSGVATSVLEVVAQLKAAFGADTSSRVTGAFRVGDIRHNVADLAKARALLGYEPKVGFAEGIRQFVAWARHEGPKSSGYEQSLKEMADRGLMRMAQQAPARGA